MRCIFLVLFFTRFFFVCDQVYPSKDFRIKAKWERFRRRDTQIIKCRRRRWSYSWYWIRDIFFCLHRESKFPCCEGFPLIFFYKCFVWKDLENKIETRRKAFLEAAPIMRKSFSGTQMHTLSCDTNTIFTFSEIESTHLIALITNFLQYNIININSYIQNCGFSLHWKYGGSTLDFGSNLYSSAYLSNKTKSSSCYHVLFW